MTRSISHRAPLPDVLDALVEGARALLEDSIVALRLVDQNDPGWLDMVASAGIAPDHVAAARRCRVGEGAGGEAVVQDRLVVVEDYPRSTVGLETFRRTGLSAAMAAPVHDHGAVIGSLTVGSYVEGRRFSAVEREVLTTFAEHASLALSDARSIAVTNHQAFHDSLTGLANRALFLDRLDHALAVRGRDGSSVAVLFVDLDRFKQVNDTLGHAAGDVLLKEVAGRITDALRPGDTAARFGGDEFAILVEDIDRTGAIAVADRVLVGLRSRYALQGREVAPCASVGIALSSPGAQRDELLRSADLAMYRAKSRGRDRYEMFEPAMWSDVVAAADLEGELQRALERGDLELHYQPIVDLRELELVGAEALLRFRHPVRGPIPASELIAVAEESGLILAIGRWTLEQACRDLQRWSADARALPFVSVNLSARQLAASELTSHVTSALVMADIEPGRLVLEISESVIGDGGIIMDALDALRAIGVRLTIDDFGIGNSSLTYLKRLPVDMLKIDTSLIEGIDSSARDLALVRTILSLSGVLGLVTIAEGIETLGQLRALRAAGCRRGQGIHICPPVPAREIEALLPRVLDHHTSET